MEKKKGNLVKNKEEIAKPFIALYGVGVETELSYNTTKETIFIHYDEHYVKASLKQWLHHV